MIIYNELGAAKLAYGKGTGPNAGLDPRRVWTRGVRGDVFALRGLKASTC